MKTKTLFTLGLIILSATLFAQKIDDNVVTYDTTHVHLLMTNYGAVYEGRAVDLDSAYILFLFNGDTLDFPMEEVHHLTLIDINIPESQLEKIAVIGTEKIFFMPSGFGLKAGKTEIRTIWLAFNSVEHGITNHLSIGADAGLSIVEENLIGLKIKGSFDINNQVHAAAGAGWQYLMVPEFPNETFTYLYGALTFGTRERFFNIASGVIYAKDN
jgi:hypothetical protein